jgi:hypothetical protein
MVLLSLLQLKKVETKQRGVVFILRYCVVILGQRKERTEILAALVWYEIKLWVISLAISPAPKAYR